MVSIGRERGLDNARGDWRNQHKTIVANDDNYDSDDNVVYADFGRKAGPGTLGGVEYAQAA